MTTQYLRKCSLIVGNPDGEGLDLSDLHVRFETHRQDVDTPAWAAIRVYNMAPDVMRRVQKEFTGVWLRAGYEGSFGLIFAGTMRQMRAGRENATDTFLEIIAADGDMAYNFAVVNKTLAAGMTSLDVYRACLEAFGKFGIVAGNLPVIAPVPFPRGQALFGMARDLMRGFCESNNCSWKITDGRLDVMRIAEPLPGEVFDINSASGMIGSPVQTIDGINVRCLLNPKLKFGGMIHLNNADIQGAPISVAVGFVNTFPSADKDGMYKIYSVEHFGDTRGNAWETRLISVAINGTAPLQGPYINASASSTGN